MRGVSAVSSDEGPCARHASRALRRACGQGAVLSLCMVRPGSGRRIECRVLRRSRGIGEIAEVEVWMGWRLECRVLRRSGVDSEAMELMQR